jgi:DNA-binding PadR family transcriptional regulator
MNDLILLAALFDGPKHGWALKKLAGFLTGAGDMHNNLVYPLMKKFVAEGWVRRQSEPGERGQTRGVYSLTPRGKQELQRRLESFDEKQAGSGPEFRVRVGLFSLVSRETRAHILAERDGWLASRERHFNNIRSNLDAMGAPEWGYDVVAFLLEEVRGERKWIKSLTRKSAAKTEPRKAGRR